jgi:hypothetical protein
VRAANLWVPSFYVNNYSLFSPALEYTGRKISVSLSNITVRGEWKMERARGEKDAFCAVTSPPSPYLVWLAANVCIRSTKLGDILLQVQSLLECLEVRCRLLNNVSQLDEQKRGMWAGDCSHLTIGFWSHRLVTEVREILNPRA